MVMEREDINGRPVERKGIRASNKSPEVRQAIPAGAAGINSLVMEVGLSFKTVYSRTQAGRQRDL